MASVVAVETIAATTEIDVHLQGQAAGPSSSSSTPSTPIRPTLSRQSMAPAGDQKPTEWGQNFWVTLLDPQTGTQFYACPSTGETTWDAPVGNFVLPPSTEGEWWELHDETRNGTPYYYHTKSGETTWEKPEGFVIPLGVIQNSNLGRRLSQSTRRHSHLFPDAQSSSSPSQAQPRVRRTVSREPPSPISEKTEDVTAPSGSGSSKEDRERHRAHRTPTKNKDTDKERDKTSSTTHSPSRPPSRTRSRGSPHKHGAHLSPGAGSQSLTAAVEYIAGSTGSSPPDPKGTVSAPDPRSTITRRDREKERERVGSKPTPRSVSSPLSGPHGSTVPELPKLGNGLFGTTDAPVQAGLRRSPFSTPPSVVANGGGNGTGTGTGTGWRVRPRHNTGAAPFHISSPVLDPEATKAMSPLNQAAAGVDNSSNASGSNRARVTTKRLSTGDHPTLPRDLVFEIQQFAQSDFARRYFATHREGLIFRRRVPMERMMTWQKAPLTSPLLLLTKSLHKNAVRTFKSIQRIMGDRDRDTSASFMQHTPTRPHLRHTESSSSLQSLSTSALLEEERGLLAEGISHGEMRDEIYCQVIKQLIGNPNKESVFRGWQLLCVVVITFPPSKNFEPYVRSFMQQKTVGEANKEGRIDVMARYCLKRLEMVSKKGPRGKAPTVAEIEIASDAAFNPSTFGESLDSTYRLQQRTYPSLKVPVILPFLSDGILALGGTKCEGIFRVPGDADSVSELRLRIDKGVYTLEGIDDPHVLASLLKLWLRELRDPVIPNEMYQACIECSGDPEQVVGIVTRLPALHRRVLLFVVSFLQLFLDERVVGVTKMGAENLALLMAPNLLRCVSEDITDVFKNTKFEQNFVYQLLLHLRCDKIDQDYIPEHGKGAVATSSTGRRSHQKSRRPKP